MNETMTNETTADGAGTEWSDAVAASFDAQTVDVTREEVTDSIDVPADPIKIGKLIVSARTDIRSARTAFEAAKATTKARKADLESAEGDLDELIDALESGTHTIEGTFLVEDDFPNHVERWFWKDTGELAREIAIPASKLQAALPFPLESNTLDSVPPPGLGGDDFSDDDDEGGDLEDRMARALNDDDDSQTNLTGDPDDIDPAAVLLDAAKGTAPAMVPPPKKPIKRGSRKTKVS